MHFVLTIVAVDDESCDELSTGVVVAISIVVTFIITLVVTALISVIITSLYYKCHKSVEGDSHALTEDIKSNDPAYAIARDTNPQWILIQLMELPLPSKWILTQLICYYYLVI